MCYTCIFILAYSVHIFHKSFRKFSQNFPRLHLVCGVLYKLLACEVSTPQTATTSYWLVFFATSQP
nr:MAG TPA: hypothetical protein [Bacteriophage sp.]